MGLSWKKGILGVFTGFLNFLWHDRDEHKRPRKDPPELEKPTVKIGDSLYVVFGTCDIKKAQLAWSGDVQINPGDTRDRKSGVIKYYAGLHFILCDGNADKIVRVRVDEKDIYNSTFLTSDETDTDIIIDDTELFGGSTRDGGVSGTIRFQQGFETQQKSEYLASAIYDEYVDYAPLPAFRGVTGLLAEEFYLGTSDVLKKWDFRVQRIHYTDGEAEQWYDEKAAIKTVETAQLVAYNETWEYQEVELYPSDALWVSDGAPFGYGTIAGLPWPINTTSPWQHATYYKVELNWDVSTDILLNGYSVTSCTGYLIPDELVIGEYFNIESISQYKIYDSSTDESATPGTLFSFEKTIENEEYSEGTHVLLFVVEPGETPGYENYFVATVDQIPQFDMNPAHIIREYLTSKKWGRGEEASLMGDSFTDAADLFYEEKLGMSVLFDRGNISGEEFIQDILRHVDAKLFVSRTTGKYELIPIRDDYDSSTLRTINESNCKKITNYKRAAFGDLIGAVNVKYSNPSSRTNSAISVKDGAVIASQGTTITKNVEYKGFSSATNATNAGLRDLLMLSTQLVSCTVEAFREFGDLEMGDVIKVTSDDHKMDEMVCRINGVKYPGSKDKTVVLDCVQDIFTLPQSTVTIVDNRESTETPRTPSSVQDYFIDEIPYYVLWQLKGSQVLDYVLLANDDAGYIGSAACFPDTGATKSAEMWVSNTGAAYEYVDDMYFCPKALLESDITETQGTFNLDSSQKTDFLGVGEFFSIGDEILQIISYSGAATDIIEAKRGVLDTIPAEHSAGDSVVFWHNYLVDDPTQYTSTLNISVKNLTRTATKSQQLAEVGAVTTWFNSRAIRPYPPGNLTINTEYFPEVIEGQLVLSWAHRNRLSQTISDFTDGSVTTETDVTYNLRIYDAEDTLLKEETELTGTTYTYSDESPLHGVLRIELESERDGYTSLNMYNHTVNRAGFGLQFGRYFGGKA